MFTSPTSTVAARLLSLAAHVNTPVPQCIPHVPFPLLRLRRDAEVAQGGIPWLWMLYQFETFRIDHLDAHNPFGRWFLWRCSVHDGLDWAAATISGQMSRFAALEA